MWLFLIKHVSGTESNSVTERDTMSQDLITFGLYIQLLCVAVALLVYLTAPGNSGDSLIALIKRRLGVAFGTAFKIMLPLNIVLVALIYTYSAFSDAQERKQTFCLDHSFDQRTQHTSYVELNACIEHQSIWSWFK